jgi:NAD-dependent deacetylase
MCAADTNTFDLLISKISNARRITVMTGAGVSAASGVPTFRGEEGLWRRYRAADLATPQAFARDPKLVWEWYAWRREKVAACVPNRVHEVLAAWTRRMPACQLMTQNVDDLHMRAGSERLIRLHGSLWELSCWENCGGDRARWRDERVPFPDALPRCIRCGGLARPAVVWFGEPLDLDVVDVATRAAECDVFLTVGTSAVVYPAAGLVHHAKLRGAFTAEINLEETPATPLVEAAVKGPAERVLHDIEQRL